MKQKYEFGDVNWLFKVCNYCVYFYDMFHLQNYTLLVFITHDLYYVLRESTRIN